MRHAESAGYPAVRLSVDAGYGRYNNQVRLWVGSKQIHEVEEVVKWLNEKKDIYVLAVLPDFKSYSYHILYEEIDDAS